MGNRSTPRKRVKRLFEQSQNQLRMMFSNLQTIRAFHEGRDTEKDLYDFFGVMLNRLAEMSILTDVARWRFRTGRWPETTNGGPSGDDQVRDPGGEQGNVVGAGEAGDDEGKGAAPVSPTGTIGKPTDSGDAGSGAVI